MLFTTIEKKKITFKYVTLCCSLTQSSSGKPVYVITAKLGDNKNPVTGKKMYAITMIRYKREYSVLFGTKNTTTF